MKEILCPNCSEYVFKLGIKKSEIPYIKKRVNELFSNKEDRKNMFEEFLRMVDMPDVPSDFMSTEYVEPYDKIKDELLAKRYNDICPFCKEKQENIISHIKDNHKEELTIAVGCLNEEEYKEIRKKLIVENL